MGYETRLNGQVTVTPSLNLHEVSYLTQFARTRRMLRTKGPYYAQGSGFMGQDKEPDILDYNKPPVDQPGLWCEWLPSSDRTAIVVDEESEKVYDADRWMLYLIVTFLRPGATVAHELQNPTPGRVYPEEFAGFTFDHVLNGMFEAQGDYEEDVWRLIVRENSVYYQDGTLNTDGQVTFQASEVSVTLTEGRRQ